jgi:hypothetical protein
VRHQNHPQQHTESLQQHAARIAFPAWAPHPDDWASLYTGCGSGAPCTEVAVYRGTERIHYRRYTGADVMAFWQQLLEQHAE